MKTIHKTVVQPIMGEPQKLLIEEGAEFIHVDVQPLNGVCIWAVVDTDKPTAERIVRIFGTGKEMPENLGSHIGSAQLFGPDGQAAIWHVFVE